jgi:hypothetical protein
MSTAQPHDPAQAERRPRRKLRLLGGATTLILAIALAISLGATATSPNERTGTTAPANVKMVPASLTTAAPQWLVNFIKGRSNKSTEILKDLGFNCLPIGVVCWREGSYDPARWFYYGVVQTGNGPNGYLRARGWPGTTSDDPVIRTFPESWKVVIFCQTQGPWVYGRWGWTNVWDYVGHYGEASMFLSDGFIYTGQNSFVAGDCGATNMGGNP